MGISYLRSKSIENIIVTLGIIIVLSITTMLLVTFYSNHNSEKILAIAKNEIRRNTEIEVNATSRILENKLGVIMSEVISLSREPAFSGHDNERIVTLLSSLHYSSSDLTDYYGFVDENGKLKWMTIISTEPRYLEFIGGDRSSRPWFVIPKENRQPYTSSLIESIDGVDRLFLSHPVIYEGQFKGVVYTAISTEILGNFIESQLHPHSAGKILVLDRNGTILYSPNPSTIYTSIFDKSNSGFFSVVDKDYKEAFKQFITNSLNGRNNLIDISIESQTTTLGSSPIFINGQYFLSEIIISPHHFAEDVDLLIESQVDFLFIIIIIVISSTAIIMIFMIFKNKRLKISNMRVEAAIDQLKIHNRMQKEFINSVAHELRTPIQALLTYSELLSTNVYRREISDGIHNNILRLIKLSSNIVDIIKIESNSLTVNKEPSRLDSIIETIGQKITKRKNINENTNDINVIFDLEPLVVNADRERISQVIANLLENAVKFTGSGKIYASLKRDQDAALVSIIDCGPGIDPKLLPDLFSKFSTKDDGGIGMSLYICKNIIEAHGGKIWVDNNEYGGTTVEFSIPIG